MRTVIIEIAKDFSPTPIGRTRKTGDQNAVDFRSDILIPKLLEAEKRGEVLEVLLDGVFAYTSSFLEEAFGGLLRDPRVDANLVKNHLRVICNSRAYEAARRDANKYIQDAIHANEEKQRLVVSH
jgi:hypothetical protein